MALSALVPFKFILLQLQTEFEASLSALDGKEKVSHAGNSAASLQLLINMVQKDQNYEEENPK